MNKYPQKTNKFFSGFKDKKQQDSEKSTKKLRLKLQQIILYTFICLTGCSNAEEIKERDPYKPFNKTIFKINNKGDQYFLKPTSEGYLYISNESTRESVDSFYSNLGEIKNSTLHLLNFDFKKSGSSISRFAINTSFGLLGFFDVAQHIGFKKQPIDMGIFLSNKGFSTGSYIMVPVFGGRSERHAMDLPVYYVLNPLNYTVLAPLSLFEIIHKRAQLKDEIALLDKISVDKYSFSKQAYYGHRKNIILGKESKQEEQNDIDDILFDEDF